MKYILIFISFLLAGCHVNPEPALVSPIPAIAIAIIMLIGLVCFVKSNSKGEPNE